MGGVRGADIQRLRELSSQFSKKAKELNALINLLQSKTTSSDEYWKGPKANQFRDEWGQVKPTFDKFVNTLESASKSANTNADNIERAT